MILKPVLTDFAILTEPISSSEINKYRKNASISSNSTVISCENLILLHESKMLKALIL